MHHKLVQNGRHVALPTQKNHPTRRINSSRKTNLSTSWDEYTRTENTAFPDFLSVKSVKFTRSLKERLLKYT